MWLVSAKNKPGEKAEEARMEVKNQMGRCVEAWAQQAQVRVTIGRGVLEGEETQVVGKDENNQEPEGSKGPYGKWKEGRLS